MSNRLTFSLASLILILGLVFVATPAMAHPNTDENDTHATPGHMHPSITVTIADADSRTDGIQVVDTEADEPATPAATDLTPTIQFDVMLTVPVGAQESSNPVSANTFGATDVTAVAYKADFTPVGIGTGGALAFGPWAQVPATDTTSRVWQATATLTLADVTFTDANAVNPAEPTAAEATKARQAAIAAAIEAGIMVDITLNADLIQTTGLVGGPMKGQSNLASKTTVTVIAPLPDNTRPTLTVSSTEPAAAVTTGSFDIIYSTTDADMDTVTVAVSHTVVPTSAAMHYTVDDSVDGTVTVNQATADATTPMVPPASVTVTLTPSDDGGAGTAETFTVFFAAATYDPPNQLPTVTTDPTTPPTAAVTSPYTFTYTPTDLDGDTVTVAVTPVVKPDSAKSHYTVKNATIAGSNSVTITQAMPSAATMTIPAATVTITLTPNDGTADGAAVDFAVSFAAKTYTPPTDTLAAGKYQVLVGPGFDATTLPGVATVTIADFPDDLAEYLVAGGTINVEATGGDVIINEFMVARDSHKIGSGDPTDGQWIELYNKHATETATGIKVTFNQSKPAVSPAGYADRFSNVVGQGWAFLTKFDDQKVINGSTNEKAPVDFVSIRRTDTGKDGSDPSAWGMAESSLVFAPGRVGTPGGQNTVDVFKPVDNTKPKRSSVLISEVANRMNDGTEWIELKGPAGKNLKNWKLSIATAVGTETNIYTFTTDIKISDNGYLLLTDVDPLNSELAADYTNGVPAPKRYKVVTLGALPNNGNFVLILRSNKDKTNHEAIEDIAGYANLSRTNPYTTLWPLTGNVGTLNSKNKLAGGKVYRRLRDNIDGYSQEGNDANKPAFGAVGFTGLGYDRNANANDAENGGTPGYPHSGFKGDGAEAPGNVVISEIMYATGNGGPARNRNLSQWIEIHNMSDVNSVNLANWRLDIVNSGENADGTEYPGKFAENVSLSGTIPPNQTYLVVARRLGVSQETRLPLERIRNAGKKFTEQLLNPNGFHLTLKAKTHKGANEHVIVDTVGNLNPPPATRRPNAHSFAGNAWELSALGDAINEDGTRISISRRHGAWSAPNTVATGTDMKGWILTSEDQRYSGIQQLTWFGRQDDHATPGYTIGAALPVSLSTFRPERMKDTGEIVIRWTTESELDNAGFNILRSETRDGEFTKLNTQLIAGQGTTSERTTYEWKDTTAKPNVVYFYQIQDVSIDGNVATLRTARLKGNVSAVGKATTTWGQLKSLQ